MARKTYDIYNMYGWAATKRTKPPLTLAPMATPTHGAGKTGKRLASP
ncbi:MAG TPA: hypothetical protein PK002_15530 [Cellvibrio sp.]|nr:hypothetical protein [Cellvibrio sp.]